MNGPVKLSRCAIYTRKSTEHNLDLAFNSLDAQREACEAYIKSQAHEGWRARLGRDGGTIHPTPVDAQRAVVLRPVRARGDRRAGEGQDRRLEAQGHLGRR